MAIPAHLLDTLEDISRRRPLTDGEADELWKLVKLERERDKRRDGREVRALAFHRRRLARWQGEEREVDRMVGEMQERMGSLRKKLARAMVRRSHLREQLARWGARIRALEDELYPEKTITAIEEELSR